MLERFGFLMSDRTNQSQRVNDAKKVLHKFCTKGKKLWEPLHYFSTPRELPSKDVLTWTKRNVTMGYGAWESDAVHHKGFCGSTSLKHVPKGIICWRENWAGIQWDEQNSEEDQRASSQLDSSAINFLLRSIRTRSGRVISWSHRAVASYQ